MSSSRTPWGLVGLLVGAGMVAAAHVGKVPPSLPSLLLDLGADLQQAGWLLSIVNLIAALGGMAIALTVDRFGHRRLVVLGTGLCCLTSLLGGLAGSIGLLLVWRFFEGLGFLIVTVSVPTLILRIARPEDRLHVMSLWTCYMPAGAGAMMLVAAAILPGTSWRAPWFVASAASLLMLIALLARAASRSELDAQPVKRRPILREMAEIATSTGPLALALCFGAYASCWYAVVGFLPTLQVERLGFSTSTAAVVTALVVLLNLTGALSTSWLLKHDVPRAAIIAGAAVPMAFCAAGIFVDGVPDLLRLVLAGLYSAVIGLVPGALFTGLARHAPRPELIGATNGIMIQGSNIGSLLGPPVTAQLVAASGWPAAAWLTSATLGLVTLAALFLHWRERRRL